METSKKSLSTGFRALLLILSLAGYVLSLLTVVEHLDYQQGGKGIALCSLSAVINCKATLTSPIAEIFGIPLGVFGMFFYAFLSLLIPLMQPQAILFQSDKEGRKNSCVAPVVVFLFVALASIFSVGLLFYSLLWLGAICPLCAGTYAVNFIMLLLFILHYKRESFAAACSGFSMIRVGIKSLQEVSARSFLSITAVTSIALMLSAPLSPYLIKIMQPRANVDITSSLPVVRPDSQLLALWKSQPVREIPVRRGAIVDADFIQGSEVAPVTVVEFSDFQCPFCQVFSEEIDKILAKYEQQNPNKVRFVFKNFPLDSHCNRGIKGGGHQFACRAAELARCAGEQGKFHQTAQFLFTEALNTNGKDIEHVSGEDFGNSVIEYVKQSGLDEEALNSCRISGRQMPAIKQDIEEGLKLDLQGTPTIYVNGRYVEGENFSELTRMLDLAIAESIKEKQ